MGFIVMRCSAPGCKCFIRALFEHCTLGQAWASMRQTATECGWMVTPNSPDGPHYCRCDHAQDGARDPR